MLAGTPFSHEVNFSTGLPSGAVTYSLLGNDGQPLPNYNNLTITVPADTFSVVLAVPGSANTCSAPLFESRTLTWSYSTANGVVSGRTRYRVEKEIPFPVSEHGVRSKLGVEDHEVEDKDINLLMAYASLNEQFNLTPYENGGNYNTLLVVEAIEAQAALNVLPSLQLAVAKAEDSGTNKYQRFGNIDWAALEASLNNSIFKLQDLVGTDTTGLIGIIFVAAGSNTDRLTGNDYAA